MICIKAEPSIGMSHEAWAREAVAVAKRLRCVLEITANQVETLVYPEDTPEGALNRYLTICRIVNK